MAAQTNPPLEPQPFRPLFDCRVVVVWDKASRLLASAVTPEALPKFHRQTQLMTSLPQTSTIHQVTPEVLPKFHFFRLRWRRCPNSTGERN